VSAVTELGQKGAAGLFGGLAGLFRGRPLHPTGAGFTATVHVPGPTEPRLALFAQAGEYDALVRFSRGFGLPEPLPEILSLAVKVRDAYGPGADQDFLMTASGDRPVLRHAFAWGRSHLAHGYSTVIPFTAAGRTVVFGAVPVAPPLDDEDRDLPELEQAAARGDLALDLRVATLRGPWHTLARVDVGRPLDDAEERALTFNSDTTGGGIAATGFVNRLRGAAYDASTRARPT
jgi:hypothetical protein